MLRTHTMPFAPHETLWQGALRSSLSPSNPLGEEGPHI